MMVTTETYRFALPDAEGGVIIRGFQEYGSDHQQQAGVYQLEVPDSLQDLLNDRQECGNWTEVVQMLASAFCAENEELAASLINR
jgi:hypothetical protein